MIENEAITTERREEVKEEMVIPVKSAYKFEGKNYDKIDLAGLKNIKAIDVINVCREVPGIYPEYTLEFALKIAAVATGKPIEFFEQMPPFLAMKIKKMVSNFLFEKE